MKHSESCPICGSLLNREYLRVLRPHINQTVGTRITEIERVDVIKQEERISSYPYPGEASSYTQSPTESNEMAQHFEIKNSLEEQDPIGPMPLSTMPDFQLENNKVTEGSVVIDEILSPTLQKLSTRYYDRSDRMLLIKPFDKEQRAVREDVMSSSRLPICEDQLITKRPHCSSKLNLPNGESVEKSSRDNEIGRQPSNQQIRINFPSRTQIGRLFMRPTQEHGTTSKFHRRNSSASENMPRT